MEIKDQVGSFKIDTNFGCISNCIIGICTCDMGSLWGKWNHIEGIFNKTYIPDFVNDARIYANLQIDYQNRKCYRNVLLNPITTIPSTNLDTILCYQTIIYKL